MTTKNVPLEPTEYMLIPYHLRERLSDALFMSEMCCDDIIEAVANAPLQASPRVVDDDMLDAACEAYADMYDVEYIDGNNRDNRRACIKAALQAALEAK